jgi:hypothetical protein
MRGVLALLLVPVVVAAAAADAGDALLPGLHVYLRKPIVHRGGILRARVDWASPEWVFATGELTARWQLRDTDGTVVANGRRPVHLGTKGPSYRFPLSVRVPRSLDWTTLTVEVALIDDPSWYSDGDLWSRGEATVAVQPGGTYYFQRESFTGTLAGGYGTQLNFTDDPQVGPLDLFGPGETDLRANPTWEGSRVTVTGRRFRGSEIFFPEDAGALRVETVEWLDPLPEDLPFFGAHAEGVVPARLPPPEVLGEVNWARFARGTREPVVVETAAEMAALHADLGTADTGGSDPLAAFGSVDFSTHRVVVVFAGVSPDPAWFVRIESTSFDPGAVRTLVAYSVIAPAGPSAGGFHWSEPYAALAIPRRDGPVEFLRHEWIPELPPWW